MPRIKVRITHTHTGLAGFARAEARARGWKMAEAGWKLRKCAVNPLAEAGCKWKMGDFGPASGWQPSPLGASCVAPRLLRSMKSSLDAGMPIRGGRTGELCRRREAPCQHAGRSLPASDSRSARPHSLARAEAFFACVLKGVVKPHGLALPKPLPAGPQQSRAAAVWGVEGRPLVHAKRAIACAPHRRTG